MAKNEPSPRRTRTDNDGFRETVSAPVTNPTYRSEVAPAAEPSPFAQLVRYVAVVIGTLLAIRFIINLFNPSRTSGLVNFFYSLTDWAVRPFQAIFGQPPAGTGGYFDWPTLAALVAAWILTALLLILRRPSRV